MTSNRPLIAGRALVFIAILVFAFTLRTGVTSLSPLIPLVRESFALDTFAVALIGALAPSCFALASLTTPHIARRIGLTLAVLTSLGLSIAGHLVRSASDSWMMLAAGSMIALFGGGMGNVVLPPLVKKYFPDRIGAMTSLYVSILITSATVTSFIAVPVASATSWRVSLASWGVFALMVAIPWVTLLQKERTSRDEVLPAMAGTGNPSVPTASLFRSSTAWAVGVVLAVGAFASYALFAWLPVIVVDIAHVDLAQAGILMAIFTLVGIPPALFIPVLAQRTQRIDLIIHAGSALFLAGFAGLIFFPLSTPWLWVGILGLAPLAFPLALALINLRTESHPMSLRLSGFAQTISYLCAAVAPILVAVTYELSGGWTIALATLAILSTAGSFAAVVIRRGTTVEHDLERRSVE